MGGSVSPGSSWERGSGTRSGGSELGVPGGGAGEQGSTGLLADELVLLGRGRGGGGEFGPAGAGWDWVDSQPLLPWLSVRVGVGTAPGSRPPGTLRTTRGEVVGQKPWSEVSRDGLSTQRLTLAPRDGNGELRTSGFEGPAGKSRLCTEVSSLLTLQVSFRNCYR